MILRSLFVSLGLTKDETSFATGLAAVELIKVGLEAVADVAREAKDFLKEQITATVEAGVETKRLAQSMGLQTDEFQRLAYAAKISEVSTDTLRNGLRELAQKGVKDLGGKILELADRFHGMSDSGTKTALAVQYFGFRGAAMIPMLNKGSAALRSMMQEAGDLGDVMSGESLEATEQFATAQHRLGGALEGLRNTIVLPMLGTLTKWVGRIVEVVKAFREWYATSERIGPVLKLLLSTLIGIGVVLLAQAALTGRARGGWSGRAFAVGWAAMAAWGAVTAFLAAAAPIVLIGAAVAAVILIVQDLYTFFTGGDSIIGRALHKWLGPFKNWHEAVKLIWAKMKAGTLHLFDGVAAYFEGVWTKLVTLAKEAGGKLMAALKEEVAKLPGGEFLLRHIGGAAPPTVGATIGGGAASPAAAALGVSAGRGGNRVTHTTIAPVINVHAAPGMHEGHLAEHAAREVEHVVHRAIREHHDAINRETAAATG